MDEDEGMIVACSGTSAAMLAKWHEELRALKPSKRARWHARLCDKWKVAQRVRYVGEVRYIGSGEQQLPYEFEVYKQPDRAGGGTWWPVVDYTQASAALDAWQCGKRLSNFAQRMAESTDPWATFHEIQAEPKAPAPEDPDVTATRAMAETVGALPKAPREHFESTFDELTYGGATESYATRRALAATMTAFPTEFLSAAEAVGGLPPQLQAITNFLEEESLEEAARRREQMRAARVNNRRARAASEAAACSTADRSPSAANAQPPPGVQQPGAPQPERLTEADREVRRANEEARERKRLTKKAAIQPSLISTTAAADDATDLGAPAVNPPSKNARRRQEKKAKQRRAGQERVEKQRQRDDDETRKILKQVEPLRETAGTVVKEDLETLESVQALEAALQREERSSNQRFLAKPGRKLLGKMRYEVLAFVEAYEGTAPEAANFARNLLDGLGQRSPEEGYDRGAAEELYGDFADSFAAHTWHAPHLRQTEYATVLRAAALA